LIADAIISAPLFRLRHGGQEIMIAARQAACLPQPVDVPYVELDVGLVVLQVPLVFDDRVIRKLR